MRRGNQRQIKTLLWIGFGGLLLLMCGLSASALSFLYQIEIRHEAIRQDYVKRDRMLEKVRSEIYVSGTHFRDFVLDESETRAGSDRDRFLATERELLSDTGEYGRMLGQTEREPFEELRKELRDYFAAIAPALGWNAQQRRTRGNAIIQAQLLPRRTIAISLSERVQQYRERQLEADSEAVSEMFSSFRSRLLLLLALTLATGTVLAAVTMLRLLSLERVAEEGYRQVVSARAELKQLSAELLAAQETERRRISRELHDDVGQVLSAMMLGLGNLRSSLEKERIANPVLSQLQLIEDMTERSAREVRNLSLVLRPTMLDDLGLIAALKWLARETTRTSSLQAEVLAEDAPDELPEEHRTCVYRVVQEAIRNTSRHSGAHHARITVETTGKTKNRRLMVRVQDDGKGFHPETEKGMGILGMEERVERLGGVFHVDSEAGRGTKVAFELPVPESMGSLAGFAMEQDQETRPFRTA